MTNRSAPAGKASLLAIDSGGRACSVAVWRDGSVVAHAVEATDHGQAALLLPLIERVMAESDTEYAALNRIGVSAGPGSFTGLRVGLAAAIGIGLAVDVPVVGISSFQTVAAGLEPDLRRDRRLFILLDSRRDELFLAELDADLQTARPPSIAALPEIRTLLESAGPVLLAGDVAITADHVFPDHVRVVRANPDAASVAMLAADPKRRYDLPARPIYLRAPDVTMARTR